MPDPTVNEEIAELLGYTKLTADGWRPPSGHRSIVPLPLFDSDPAEAWELVELCRRPYQAGGVCRGVPRSDEGEEG
jgi:hypothetical protein